MSLEDDIAFFRAGAHLRGAGQAGAAHPRDRRRNPQLQSGAVLFYAGELADGGYVVQEGSLLLEPGTFSEGKEIIVGPGTLVGELALLTDMVCPATAIAKEPTVVIRISRSLFKKMLEGYPDAAVKLRDIMAERLDDWTRELGGGEEAMISGEGEEGGSDLHRRRHRHVVGRARGAAVVLGDLDVRDAVGQRVRGPDVIEPPAAVGGFQLSIAR